MKVPSLLMLTDAQLACEVARCEYCATKPCKDACPSDCSPADFIMAVKVGERSDFKRSAALIMGANPLGGVCGEVCPESHCMRACARATFDTPIEIPAVQAKIIQKARELGVMPKLSRPAPSGRRIAIVGGGPAGFGAAAVLAQHGHQVVILEAGSIAGGMASLIPGFRLDPAILAADLAWVEGLGSVAVHLGAGAGNAAELLAQGYDAVVVASGLDRPLRLGVPGEELAANAFRFLRDPARFAPRGKRLAVIGGGGVAADCAVVAALSGAAEVEIIALEKWPEMPLAAKERAGLLEAGVSISGRTRVSEILAAGTTVTGLRVINVSLPAGMSFHPRHVVDVPGSEQTRSGFDLVVVAIGGRSSASIDRRAGVFYAGDMENGPTTVVEAVAAGKNAALEVEAFLKGEPAPVVLRKVKSRAVLAGRDLRPVPLAAEFFGRPIASPFLLSAGPPSDGYEQLRRAYEAGWPGGVMKTAFDNVPIHIPAEYMFSFSRTTYANCDNVSGHPLDRVCREVAQLRREFPDRLTLASTGGPVTGSDELDSRVWQASTRKLEAAGVLGIEYSLSCPQGGDGTKGEIVAQDPELTAKIIGWVLAAGDPEVPKLFKLTPAVTAIYPIISAVKQAFSRFPRAKAGVTLANSFPTLAFRKGGAGGWDAGVVVGMSGDGVAPISFLTLANVARLGVVVSGNGGVMDYRAAAGFLALGARTVQLCSAVMKYGFGIIEELHSGLSFLLEERGMRSVGELIGCALPSPITPFGELGAVKGISQVRAELCTHCGNCTRCPYLAIALDGDAVPVTDPARCVGCSFCVQQCFAGALAMRERSAEELAALREA